VAIKVSAAPSIGWVHEPRLYCAESRQAGGHYRLHVASSPLNLYPAHGESVLFVGYLSEHASFALTPLVERASMVPIALERQCDDGGCETLQRAEEATQYHSRRSSPHETRSNLHH